MNSSIEIESVHKYANEVLSGKISACKYIKQACQIFITNLQRQKTTGFAYRFDEDVATKYIRIIEKMQHVDGVLANQPLILEPWQRFLIANIFGWLIHGGKLDGIRKHSRIYLEVGRGAGKSTLTSAICLAELILEKQQGGQIICSAKTAEQANIVFEASKRMAGKFSGDLQRKLGIEISAHAITNTRTSSKMFKVSSDNKGSQDGKLPIFISIDELHAHTNRDTYDAMEQTLAKRPGATMLCITTAGNDTSSICFEVHSHLCKVLSGVVEDNGIFGLIYTIDEPDEWDKPESWKMANPNYGISVVEKNIAELCNKAKSVPSAKNTFLTKQLCIWTSEGVGWMPLEKWKTTKHPTLDIKNFAGKKCYMGVDFGTRSDLCGKVYVFPEKIDGITHYNVFAFAYLPEAAIKESRNSQYGGWVNSGLLYKIDGDTVDYDIVEKHLVEDYNTFDIKQIAFDRWGFIQAAQRLINFGLPMTEVGMTVSNLSEPMKEILSLTLQKRIKTNNPILDWCMSNVEVRVDQNDNIFPRKAGNRPENKKDLADALILAMCVALQDNEDDFDSLVVNY